MTRIKTTIVAFAMASVLLVSQAKAAAFLGDEPVAAPALEMIDRATDRDFADLVETTSDFSSAMSENHNLLSALRPIDAERIFGNQARVFVFLANKNKAVGMNFTPEGENAGLSVERGAYIGDIHAGIGVRKGALQYGIGYVHRSISSEGVSQDQNFVAFMVSIKAN